MADYAIPDTTGTDVRPVGSSADSVPAVAPPDGYRPQDSGPPIESAPEVIAEQPPAEPDIPSTPPEKKPPEAIPYDRFQEVIHERNELRKQQEAFAQNFQALPPEVRLLIENPNLTQDPTRLMAIFGAQKPQEPPPPNFDAIEDPYEREIARSQYVLKQEIEQRTKPILEKLQAFETRQQEQERLKLIQEGERILQEEQRTIFSRPEIAAISDVERKVIIQEAIGIAAKANGMISLEQAYKLTPHYERLMRQSLSAGNEAKRTGGGAAPPSGVSVTPPQQAKSLYAAFESAWPKE